MIVRLPGPRTLTLVSAMAALALAGCGSDEEGTTTEDLAASAPAATSFPSAKGRTLDELAADEAQLTNEIVVAPAGQVYTTGRNELGFGVFTVAQEQITDAELAIYAAPGPDGEAIGPFPAAIESLLTEPEFEAQTTSDDPDSARVVYRTGIDFDQPGEWRLLGMIRDGDRLLATRIPSAIVDDYASIPEEGEMAPPCTP